MPALHINLEGDGMLKDIPHEESRYSEDDIHVGVLPGGMASGKPSVGIAMTADGMLMFGQTSMALFLMAALAMYARYGDAGTGITITAKA